MNEKEIKQIASRYGIAEWFGQDVISLTKEEREKFADISLTPGKISGKVNLPICPFLSQLIPNSECNKAGGVCSIRKFEQKEDGSGAPSMDESIVCVCPSRFLEKFEDGTTLFSWISETVLAADSPIIVKETPFLRKVDEYKNEIFEAAEPPIEDTSDDKMAGRIDWIIVNPSSIDNQDIEWCAIETQALYFSGDSMKIEFESYKNTPERVSFPAGKRRPDYRSSGPKRLSPQLDVKVPVLRNWGKKVVVVVDTFFFRNMNKLVDVSPRARDDFEKRDNAEVIWFVVGFNEHLKMNKNTKVYTTLASSRTALNATEPLNKIEFNQNLKAVIASPSKSHKVFKP